MHHDDVLFGRVKNGVLTVSGHFPRITVELDDLNIADGHGDTAVSLKLRRADRLVSRIIVTRSEGYISFAAVKWLRDVGIGLAQLDFNGDVIMATAQRSLDLASMRRAQCLAAGSDFGRSIVRELLQAKLDGQAAVARIPPAVSGVRRVRNRCAGRPSTTSRSRRSTRWSTRLAATRRSIARFRRCMATRQRRGFI
jgi:hypothetical protein